jgi:hypothetical protein
MCIKCKGKKNEYPPRIREALEQKGFFDMMPEEIIQKSQACWKQLAHSSKGDPGAEREALNELRGGIE